MRYLLAGAVLLGAGAFSLPAAAWVEMNPKALVSTVEVEPDGHATVTEALTLDLRGGPLRRIELFVADTDAEPVGDATVRKLPSGAPLELLVERRADGALVLEVNGDKGLRTGSYFFSLRYRTDLAAARVLRPEGEGFDLAWVGPRLEGGMDGVRTIFRVPSADLPPRLPDATPDNPASAFGVLVAAVRNTPGGDEIELVRSHVASGEPPLWRVRLSGRAFPALVAKAAPVAAPELAPRRVSPVVRSPRWLLASLAVGLVYALFVLFKAREQRRASERSGATLPPLVRWPLWLRSPLAGLAGGLALFAGAELELPAAVGVALAVALALGASGAPVRPVRPRGPGRWLLFQDDDAFARPENMVPPPWLDSGSARGFLLFATLMVVVLVFSQRELASAPYRALLFALLGALPFPIFFTGRASELSIDRVAFARRFLRKLAFGLRRRGLKAVPWARVPEGRAAPDELRVLVKPRDAIEGLVALEVALEGQPGMGGLGRAPYVIVRVREGSRAERALPPGMTFGRGRKPEERIAILSPPLPTLGLTLELVEGLVDRLAAQPPKSSLRSSGRSAATAKLRTVASPAHAT